MRTFLGAAPGSRHCRTLSAGVWCTICIAILTLALALPSLALAQFIYLDSNGDGVNTAADVLNEAGTPTTVAIWLDTARNADSSAVSCPMAQEPLSLFSYCIVLRAVGGAVSYGTYVNAQTSMNMALGSAASETDFYAGYGGTTKLAPGLYRLGTVTVTVLSGSPSLSFATSTSLSPAQMTLFGTECPGREGSYSYLLGVDWLDAFGCSPPGGANAAPQATVPARVTADVMDAVTLAGAFSDWNIVDSISVTVTGLPPGLSVVEGRQVGGEKKVRIYGVLGEDASADSRYALNWIARDGGAADTARTDLLVRSDPPSPAVVETEVRDLVERVYEHGMPRVRARRLGGAALPTLAGIMRDEVLRPVWKNAAAAIGYIGDAAYFDTLRAFIWDRFSGDVDANAFRAVKMAQISLGVMASTSTPVLDYLERCVDPDAWQTVRWYWGTTQGHRLGVTMSLYTLIALGYTDSERAASILRRVLAEPFDADQVSVARESLDRLDRIRARGIEPIWDEEDRALGLSR